MDRFYDSTTAYQGYGRGIALEQIDHANKIATGGLEPDLTFFIDISWEEARRRNLLKGADRMESEDHPFFDRIRNGYVHIAQADPKRLKLIDGSLPVEMIAAKIFEHSEKLIKKND
jgi:dTMP kinase